MTWVCVDIEADGPIPGDYSMISFGAVVVEPELNRTFYAELRPISNKWVPEALAVSGFSREETMKFPEAEIGMREFADWLQTVRKGGLRFIADNNGFDWMFICWYFHHFLGENPFGFSSANLNSLFHGLNGSTFKSFKYLRKTKHDHNPVNDAKGNAEAMLYMREHMGLKWK